MTFPSSPQEAMQKLQQLEDELRQEGQVRHDRMLSLGYRMAAGVHGTVADASDVLPTLWKAAAGESVQPTFHIWRIDQPPNTAKIFGSIAEADQYLAHVATLPRYRLDLDNNARLVIEDGNTVRITDRQSGEHFDIPRSDLPKLKDRSTGETQIRVHADAAPTIGNWMPE